MAIILKIVFPGLWKIKPYFLSPLYKGINVLFVLIFYSSLILAESNPPILTFDPVVYGADNQNWKIDQLPNGDMAFANGNGLLIYNGEQWNLYHSHLTKIIRSVRAVDNMIYSGSDMDFGFWNLLSDGSYKYTSLVEKLKYKIEPDEVIWNIIKLDEKIIFQSLEHLYYYYPKSEEIKKIVIPNGVNKIFSINAVVYVQSFTWDIYKLTKDEDFELFYSGDELPASEILGMFSTEEGILIFIKENGFYKYVDGKFVKWYVEDESILDLGDFFSAIKLFNGDYVLGSITRGVFVYSREGRLKLELNLVKGLNNNTVLSLFEDRSSNLWLGMDNGINKVNLNSPFTEYLDKSGILGTVYTSIVFNGYLYVGTNQGLFYKQKDEPGEFQMVANSNGQVWSLFAKGSNLFCGHNLGTFIIEENRAKKLSGVLGTWKFENIPGKDDLLLQGNYDGLHLLKKQNATWNYESVFEGIDLSARQFVYNREKIYLFHLTKGLIRYKVNAPFNEFEDSFLIKKSIPNSVADILKLGDQIIYGDQDGIYLLDQDEDKLKNLNYSAEVFKNSKDYKLIEGAGKSFWMIKENKIMKLSLKDEDHLEIDLSLAMDPLFFKCKNEYENLSYYAEDKILLGMTTGFFTMDLGKIDQSEKNIDVRLGKVELNSKNGEKKLLDLKGDIKLENTENNFTFYFNVMDHSKYQDVEYRYLLDGEMDDWSNWTYLNSKSFHKLKPGKYSFLLVARSGSRLSTEEIKYDFSIDYPWFKSIYAYISYLFLFFTFAMLVNNFYTRTYKRKNAKLLERNKRELQLMKLENEQKLMKVKNEQLSDEIKSKNKELAVTAMSLVKKNEFLIGTRDILRRGPKMEEKTLLSVIKSINREIENEESWNMLKNAFENVDKNFIKAIKKMHPELTPSDLKLCTYLRLNMNSKEIATLLNISVRSMETKRYRLRKKLDLSHETNLVEYILSI